MHPFTFRILATGLLLASTLISQPAAAEDRFLNIAAFQKTNGAYEFDPLIMGSFSEFVAKLEQNATLLFINRASRVQDQDVINLQSDVLRMRDGTLVNGGVNCRFSYNNETTDDSAFYSVRGLCDIMQAKASGTAKHKAIIKRTMLSEPGYGTNLWIKLYEDKESGIAFYADMD